MVAVLMATRLIDVPFTSGIDESVDATLAPLPAMTELVNYRLTRAGRLEHRLGMQSVGVSVAVNSGTGARPNANQAQAISGRMLVAGGHAYTDAALGEWVCNGSVSRFVPWESYQALGNSVHSYSNPTCASVFGFLVCGASQGSSSVATGGVDVKIFDERTGALVWTQRTGQAAGAPDNRGRVVACGANAVVVTQDLATGLIGSTNMTLTSLPYAGFPAVTNWVAAIAASGFDAAADADDTYIASYHSGVNVVLAKVGATGHSISASVAIPAGGALAAYTTCLRVGNFYYLAWMNAGGAPPDIRCAVFDLNLVQIGVTQIVATVPATTLSGHNFRPVLGRFASASVIVGWMDSYVVAGPPNFATYRTTFRAVTSTAALSTTYGPFYGSLLASKPFNNSSSLFSEATAQPCVWLANYNPNVAELDRSHFLVTLGTNTDSSITWEMSASPSRAIGFGALFGPTTQVSEVARSTAAGPVYWQTTLMEGIRGLGTANVQARTQVYRFGDAVSSMRARTRCVVSAAGSQVVLGGAPRYFDNSWMTEIGSAHGPIVITARPTTGGSMTGGKTYRYVFVLEYFDARGQRQLSYVSSPTSVTLAALDTLVQFEILAPGIWANPNAGGISDSRRIVVRAYRTAGDVGTVFRFTPCVTGPNGMPAGPMAANGRATYSDESADATIAANEAIYVQVGNALSNYRAPPCTFGCEHEGRLIVAGGWDRSAYVASKLFFAGEGIQFTESASFTDVCPEPITGCASLDGSLVLFAERAIYVVSGDGPTDDGAGSFNKPRRLPGRVGCMDWRSVVTNEEGIFFRGADGLYQLPRGLAAPVFLGNIREVLRLFPETLGAATVTRAVSPSVSDHDSERVVAWLVGDAESPEEVAIFVLSLATKAFSRVSLPTLGALPHVVMGAWQDMANGSDALAFALETIDTAKQQSLLAENTGSGYDQDIDGSYTPLLAGSWKTGKIFPFGFGGRGSIRSIRLVGECLAATTLTPTVYADSDTSGYASSALSFAPGRFAVEIPFRRRDLAWVQIAVADPTSGSENRGAGLRFNGLALEVEMEAGLHRTAPSERSI